MYSFIVSALNPPKFENRMAVQEFWGEATVLPDRQARTPIGVNIAKIIISAFISQLFIPVYRKPS